MRFSIQLPTDKVQYGAEFASAAGIKASRAKTMYVNAALGGEEKPFEEIECIFRDFAAP